MKVFITGVSGGLGIRLADGFIKSGDSVLGIGRRNPDTINRLLFESSSFNYRQCDITDYNDINRIYNEMLNIDFIPDVIILCAGDAIEDIIDTNFSLVNTKKNFDINLFGSLVWIEFFLPYFIKRKSGIFAAISSMSIYRENHKKRIAYSASKIALNKVFENFNQEYFNTGVRFIIFNMGRMREKKGLIGITYTKAASLIRSGLKPDATSYIINIPFGQYLLTRLSQLIPQTIFCKYIMK